MGRLFVLISALLCSMSLFAAEFMTAEPYLSEKEYLLSQPIELTIRYTSLENWQVQFRGLVGIPTSLRLALLGPDGTPVQWREDEDGTPGAEGPGGPPKPGEVYFIGKDESFLLAYDLTELFNITQPGSYTLSVTDIEGNPARTLTFTIHDVQIQHELKLIGIVESFENIRKEQLRRSLGAYVQCHMIIGSTVVAPEEWYAMLISDKIGEKESLHSIKPITDKEWRHSMEPVRVPKNTELVTAVVDMRWRVWAVLKFGEQQSLLVWDIPIGKVLNLLPFAPGEIKLGTATPNPLSNSVVVIAGRVGQTMFTTLGLRWGPPVWTTGKQIEEVGDKL